MSQSHSFSVVPGFFVQDDPKTIPHEVGALPLRFGLLDDSPRRWDNFRTKVDQLNQESGTAVYKVFILGRHGQGYHNVGEEKYGTKAWDDYWSKLNGDDELTWGPDPLLTPLGQAQAGEASYAWNIELKHGIPFPEKFLSSPLKRALDTLKTTFIEERDVVVEDEGRRGNVKVLILENCREEYGEHTCDLRSSLSSLKAIYPPPTFQFEPGFAEEDPLWEKDVREGEVHIVQRALIVLEKAFEGPETYISLTAHGGFINGFLHAIGRPSYALPTGGVLPVVVRRDGAPTSHTNAGPADY